MEKKWKMRLEGLNVSRPTPAQHAFINSLYNQLGVGYLDRVQVNTKVEAGVLIGKLKQRVEEKKNKGGYHAY